jgi:hypothetical protein
VVVDFVFAGGLFRGGGAAVNVDLPDFDRRRRLVSRTRAR